MRRTRPFVTWLSIFVILGGSGAACYALLRHEPGFYGRCQVEPGPERIKRSNECFNNFTALFTKFSESGSDPFLIEFKQDSLNSFFAEGFVKLGLAGDLAKVGVHEPRIALEKDRMRIGVRYGEGKLSTILSYDVKIWLKPNDPNLILVEILGRKAGAVPVASQQILQEMTEMGRKHGVDVRWYRHETNPVAMVRYVGDSRQQPTAQLRQIVLDAGKLAIRGQVFDPNRQMD